MAKVEKQKENVVLVEKSTNAAPFYIVTNPFQDDYDYITKAGTPTKYKVGDDVSHFEQSRLLAAIERGLVEKK